MTKPLTVTWSQREAARIRIDLAELRGETHTLPEHLFRVANASVVGPTPTSPRAGEPRPYRVRPADGADPDAPPLYATWAQREAARIRIDLAELRGETHTLPEHLFRVAAATADREGDDFAGAVPAGEPKTMEAQNSDS